MNEPPASASELKKYSSLIESWAEALISQDGPAASLEKDENSENSWYLRLCGEEKEFFGIWFHIGQRTLKYETYFMPAPLENHEELYEFLLKRSYDMYGISFSIGPEQAIFLAGRIPLADICEDELDRILGTIYEATERYFKMAMGIGYRSVFKKS